MDETLLKSLEGIVADYRAGEIKPPSEAHIKQWVEQFPEDVRDRLIAELVQVLGQTYIPKTRVQSFLAALVGNEKLTGGNPKTFWEGARLLNIQKRGSSQREMIAMFAVPLMSQLGLNTSESRKTPACYVYMDDGLFSGNHILGDLRDWLACDAPAETTVHVVVIALHRGGQYYARTALEKVANEKGKKITFSWWRIIELEDRRKYTNSSDVLRPTLIPDDVVTKAYVASMQHPPVLRMARSGVGDLKIFSSEEARSLLEQLFLTKGANIRTVCQQLNQYQRPLGNMVLETLGFGSAIMTFRNCPNNAPLVFWAGAPWHPLFERKTN